MDSLEQGSIFGKYRIERVLGKGGMAIVYLVRHTVLESEFALKVLSAEMAQAKPEFVKRFIREAKIASRIRHPNLVSVYDAGCDETTGLYYLVMDYEGGGSLRERLAFSLEPMQIRECVRITREIAAALVAAEEYHVVHRDVKPENVMFGQNDTIRLADLGLAKASDERDSLMTTTQDVFGTPSYMAPEQIEDSSTVDARADIYSLGIVFFEMLTGHRPYEGETVLNIIQKVTSSDPLPDVRTFVPNIPPALATLIADMCAKKRSARIRRAADVIARLDEIVASGVLDADTLKKPDKKRHTPIGLIGVMLLILGGVGAGIYWKHKQDIVAAQKAKAEIEAKAKIEAKRKAAEAINSEAKRKKEIEEKAKSEAKRKAEEAKRKAEEAKAKADEEARQLEAKRKKEIEEKAKAEAKRKADETKRKAEEAKVKAEEEARRLEAKRKAEEELKLLEAKRKEAEEAKRKANEAKRKADEEAKLLEAKRKKVEETKRKEVEEAKRKAEEEAKRKADEEIKAKLPVKEVKPFEFKWRITIPCDGDAEVAAVQTCLGQANKSFTIKSIATQTVRSGGFFGGTTTYVTGVMHIVTPEKRTPEARLILTDYLKETCRMPVDLSKIAVIQDFSTALERRNEENVP